MSSEHSTLGLFVCFCLETGSHYRTACLPWGGWGAGEGWERQESPATQLEAFTLKSVSNVIAQ